MKQIIKSHIASYNSISELKVSIGAQSSPYVGQLQENHDGVSVHVTLAFLLCSSAFW